MGREGEKQGKGNEYIYFHIDSEVCAPNALLGCVFLLRPIASIRLRFNYFYTECLWDYLYIFDGDSIYSTKIAALT